MLHIILVVVHIACAAILFGYPLGMAGLVRRALEVSPEAFKQATAELGKRSVVASMASMATLLTGVGLIFSLGGFATVSKNFHASLSIMIAAIVFNMIWMKPSTGKLLAQAEADTVDQEAVQSLLKKLNMGSGIMQLIWIVLLALMMYRF